MDSSGEALSNQSNRWCCIDRLNRHDLPGLGAASSSPENCLSFLPISFTGQPHYNLALRGGFMKSRLAWFVTLAAVSVGAISCNKESGPVREAVSNKDGAFNRSMQHHLM
jgi:hypothetical protein